MKNRQDLITAKISLTRNTDHGRIVSVPDSDHCLDSAQLNPMERSFNEWVERSSRTGFRSSRFRTMIVFLLIRYAGAKLSEVLAFNPFKDIDLKQHAIFFNANQKRATSANQN